VEEKYGFIYIWRDRKHKRYYIGCHWGYEDDGYICSSDWMRHAYRRRPDDFKRRIIKRIYSNKKDMFLKEHEYLLCIKENEFGKRYYNLNNSLLHWVATDKVEFIHQKFKKRVGTNLGKKFSEETKEKMRQKALGRRHTKETIDKLRAYRATQIFTPEQIEKRMKKIRGSKLSDQARLNISNGVKEWYRQRNA
jgi:hypothetical protein